MGLGAVLSQVKSREEHPVMSISQMLNPVETRYATVEKEALAIKWAVLELRYYLLLRSFTLVTDHATLQWMVQAKETNAQVTRWFLALQDFHFKKQHRAGASHGNANCLSRMWSGWAGQSVNTPPCVYPYLWGGGESPNARSTSPCKQPSHLRASADHQNLNIMKRSIY